ncbi:MAG: hemolysin family protein [Clostridiales bacterium]|nr:hemolysin family protein [Clostridiales bacterium]
MVLIFLLLLSAFFSSAETALTTVNKIRIRSMVEEGNKKAEMVNRLIENPSKLLSAILIGNNIVNLSASSLATTFTIHLCNSFGMSKNASLGTGVATGILTVLILIFGEITPKSLATRYSEAISLVYAPVIFVITQVLTPFIFIINGLSNGLLRLLHIDPNHHETTITENELRTIVDVSHEEGVIESEERKMITNVVDFGDTLVKEAMVPRIDMEFADCSYSYDELVAAFSKEKYTRLPVFEENKDHIIGTISLKDVFFYKGPKEQFRVRNYIRDAYFTYEFKKTSELFMEMKASSVSLAIVLNEYGDTAGLITMEDLLEEIVGDIRDEYDEDEEDEIQPINEQEYLVDGSIKIDDLNEAFHLHIESDEYDSLAGHVIHLLQHIPTVGEQVTDQNITFTIHKLDRNRIDKIHMLILPQDKNDTES